MQGGHNIEISFFKDIQGQSLKDWSIWLRCSGFVASNISGPYHFYLAHRGQSDQTL